MRREVRERLQRFKNSEGIELWELAKDLLKSEDRGIVPEMLLLLQEQTAPERSAAAAWLLGSLRASEAIDPLIGILEDTSQPTSVREQAAESLGYLSDQKARGSLIRSMDERCPDVCYSCIFALRTVGQVEDIASIEKFVGSTLSNSYGASLDEEAREAIGQIRERATL